MRKKMNHNSASFQINPHSLHPSSIDSKSNAIFRNCNTDCFHYSTNNEQTIRTNIVQPNSRRVLFFLLNVHETHGGSSRAECRAIDACTRYPRFLYHHRFIHPTAMINFVEKKKKKHASSIPTIQPTPFPRNHRTTIQIQ